MTLFQLDQPGLRDLARTSAGVSFEDRGEQALKGVTEPQLVFALRRGNG